MKILFAEDDENIANIVILTLSCEERFEITWCQDGAQAEEQAMTNEHQILIFDDMMPFRRGTAVCKNLREKNDARPILILSANQDYHHCGATAFMAKPFDVKELYQLVIELGEAA